MKRLIIVLNILMLMAFLMGFVAAVIMTELKQVEEYGGEALSFMDKKRTLTNINLTIEIANATRIKEYCGQEANGCATFNNWGNGCLILVPELIYKQDYDKFRTWGHELGHCVYGSWHE